MSKIIDTHPVFLSGPSGPLFALHLPPATSTSSLQYLIHVPAFAEEMNRARHLVAMQARAFADRGVGVLILDLFGTGDSAGDFADATWAIWKEDVALAVDWLRQLGAEHIALWGLRLGCLLALDFVQQREKGLDGLLFWQPLLDGKVALDQFLRLQVAAGAIGRGGKETVQGLRSRLTAGEPLEIGGYEVPPVLAYELDRCSFSSLGMPVVDKVAWLEIRGVTKPIADLSVTESDARLFPASQTVADDWRLSGCNLGVAQVSAFSFWQSHTVEPMPELLSETLRLWHSVLPFSQTGSSKGDA